MCIKIKKYRHLCFENILLFSYFVDMIYLMSQKQVRNLFDVIIAKIKAATYNIKP